MNDRPAPLPGQGIPQTVYALTQCIQRCLMAHFKGIGLHWGLRRILQRLWIADGLSQAELAQSVRSSEASASNMLKHLVKDGWVERRRDPYDYRISRVYVTNKGLALRDAIEQECARIDAEIREGLTPQQSADLTVLLDLAWDRLAAGDDEGERTDGGIGIYDQPSPPGEL